MSKWSRLKVALLIAGATLSQWGFGNLSGCLGDNWYQRVVQYTVIGNLFD